MSKAIVFCGPSLRAAQRPHSENIEVRPPAVRGDILRAALQKPLCIGLVDGYFDASPSVWHKEILWAMSRGIHVFGAASMGALRAAELDAFGMQGIGAIYSAYAQGTLDGDDEVAIMHAPSEQGYAASSDALVNIRFTLDAAVRCGALQARSRAMLLANLQAKSYSQRSYEAMLAAASEYCEDEELSRLNVWLVGNRVDQKALDAHELFAVVERCIQETWPRKQVTYVLSHTDAWDGLFREVEAEERVARGHSQAHVDESDLIEELVIRNKWVGVRTGATLRALALRQARDSGYTADPRAVESVAEAFRRERGLISREQFAAWIDSQLLAEGALADHFVRETVLRRSQAFVESELLPSVLDELRASGLYGEVRKRLERKRRWLHQQGLLNPTLKEAGLDFNSLWEWFKSHSMLDLSIEFSGFCQSNNLDHDRVRVALLREYVYARLSET